MRKLLEPVANVLAQVVAVGVVRVLTVLLLKKLAGERHD